MLSELRWWIHKRSHNIQECGLKDCNSLVCTHPPGWHSPCRNCGSQTTERRLWIEPGSLKRRCTPLCHVCYTTQAESGQARLRQRRTDRDWVHVSEPVATESIRTGVMADQFASQGRRAVRAFVTSGAPVATVDDMFAGNLQETIRSLGLERVVYAEQRDGSCVLRRIEETANGVPLLPIRRRSA